MPRTKITLSIAELLAELRRRQQKLPRLEKLAASLEKKLANVRSEIEALGGKIAVSTKKTKPERNPGPQAAVKKASSGTRPRNKLSLADAIIKVLDKDKPKNVKTIISDVKAAGYKTTSANFDTIVYQTLARERKRVEKAGRGLYKLKN